jgi:hypothetical protein
MTADSFATITKCVTSSQAIHMTVIAKGLLTPALQMHFTD